MTVLFWDAWNQNQKETQRPSHLYKQKHIGGTAELGLPWMSLQTTPKRDTNSTTNRSTHRFAHLLRLLSSPPTSWRSCRGCEGQSQSRPPWKKQPLKPQKKARKKEEETKTPAKLPKSVGRTKGQFHKARQDSRTNKFSAQSQEPLARCSLCPLAQELRLKKWLWWSKPLNGIPFWLVGEFTTHFRLPILVVGLNRMFAGGTI